MSTKSPDELFDIQVSHDVPMPMRDGTVLRSDVYHPVGKDRWPVILMRFLSTGAEEQWVELGRFFAQRGYAFVYNEVRGCVRSDGDFFPFIDEAWGENQDGYDAVVWAANQAWSNGNVGLLGSSYGAFNQYTTAPTRPPGLKACMPFFGSYAREFVFPNGVYRFEEHRAWALWMGLNCLENEVPPAEQDNVRARLQDAREDHESWVWQLPITECEQLDSVSPWHLEHLKRQTDLAWWAQMDARTKLAEIDVPMLHVGGWYDLYINGMIEHFVGLTEQGRSQQCRRGQRMLVGAWTHGGCVAPALPAPLDFGPDALVDFKALALRWFDYWLRGIENGTGTESAVRFFLMGENRWVESEQWPPAGVEYTPIYLRHGTGKNAASLNNGHLTFETPGSDEQPDTYSYDPADPIIGHHRSSPLPEIDQREREGQLLTYTSELIHEPVTIIGPVKAEVFVASSAPDTDWVVRLCDVAPDGRSTRLSEGIVRARFRHAEDCEELMEPGEVYRLAIGMTSTAHTFLPGHRLRVHVTSSDFPLYDRNFNTGGPFGEETEGQVANNTIFHDANRPSHIVLPIVLDPVSRTER